MSGKNRIFRQHLFGLGLDNDDGHKRVTRADQFSILGGSRDTHAMMIETLRKTFEALDIRGKCLEETHPEELSELLKKYSIEQ